MLHYFNYLMALLFLCQGKHRGGAAVGAAAAAEPAIKKKKQHQQQLSPRALPDFGEIVTPPHGNILQHYNAISKPTNIFKINIK